LVEFVHFGVLAIAILASANNPGDGWRNCAGKTWRLQSRTHAGSPQSAVIRLSAVDPARYYIDSASVERRRQQGFDRLSPNGFSDQFFSGICRCLSRASTGSIRTALGHFYKLWKPFDKLRANG
jgi:hypothetical protein